MKDKQRNSFLIREILRQSSLRIGDFFVRSVEDQPMFRQEGVNCVLSISLRSLAALSGAMVWHAHAPKLVRNKEM